MKRQLMKRGMMGIYAAICAGMLLVTGCAGTEPNVKTETERIEMTERQESNPVNTASKEDKDEVPSAKGDVLITHPVSEHSPAVPLKSADFIMSFASANVSIVSDSSFPASS